MFQKMEKDLSLFKTPKSKTSDGKEVDSIVYYPDHAKLHSLLHPSRGHWFEKRDEIAELYKQIAIFFISKIKKDAPPAVKANYVENYVEIMRRGNLLRQFGANDGAIQVDGLDKHIWEEELLEKEVLKTDFQVIYNGGKHDGPIEKRANNPAAEKARLEKEKADKALQVKPKMSAKSIAIYGLATLLLAAIIFLILMLVTGNLESFLPSFGGVQSQPQITQPEELPNSESGSFAEALRLAQEAAGVTNSPKAGPEGSFIPGGSPISPSLQTIQMSMLLAIGVLRQVVFWILVILSVTLAYQVFKDARARASEGDFSAFMRLMGLVVLFSILPVKAFIQIDLTIWKWYFPMPTSYNLIILLVTASGLWGIAQDRMSDELDLTPLSAGLFISGIVFLATNPVAFLSWSIPLETYIAWGLALVVHLFEMLRQEDTKEALILTGLGIVLQLIVFFGMAWALGTTASPFFLKFGQEIAFFVSVFLSVGLVSFGLNILSKQELLPAGRQMLVQVETSSHDAGLLLVMWSVIFMSQYWV